MASFAMAEALAKVGVLGRSVFLPPARLLRLMKSLGFPFETIGEPTVTYNTLNWPTRLKTSELLDTLHRTTPQLGEFFSGKAAGQRFQDVVVQG